MTCSTPDSGDDAIQMHLVEAARGEAEQKQRDWNVNTIVLGLYVRVKCGLHEKTTQRSDFTKLMTSLVRSTFPGSPFLSLAILYDPQFKLHRDKQNDWLPNLVIELRPSHGGGTWVEDPLGDTAVETAGALHLGKSAHGQLQTKCPLAPSSKLPGIHPEIGPGCMDPRRLEGHAPPLGQRAAGTGLCHAIAGPKSACETQCLEGTL